MSARWAITLNTARSGECATAVLRTGGAVSAVPGAGEVRPREHCSQSSGTRQIVGRLRLYAGVEVFETGDTIWLRGPEGGEELAGELARLPAVRRYVVDGEGRLMPAGARVPVGRLPEGPWQALDQWITPCVQTAALPGELERRIRLRLVPGKRVGEPAVLLTRIEAWAAWAVAAPQVRLDRLLFAMAENGPSPQDSGFGPPGGRVIVRGHPLPSMPGERYVEEDGIAVPCGLEVWPAVGTVVIGEALGMEVGDLVLLRADGSCERVRAGSFVRASRSAARATLEAWRMRSAEC